MKEYKISWYQKSPFFQSQQGIAIYEAENAHGALRLFWKEAEDTGESEGMNVLDINPIISDETGV